MNQEAYFQASVWNDACLVLGDALMEASVDAEGLGLLLIAFLPVHSLSS